MKPAFAESFPKDPALDELVEAFARGDYAHVRTAGAKIAAESQDEAVRRAARTLVERTGSDATTKALLALAGALLVVLSAWWIAHGTAPAASSPPGPHIERVRE